MESGNAAYESIDDLIESQNARISDLIDVVSLIHDHKYLQDYIKQILNSIYSIKGHMMELQRENEKSQVLIQKMNKCTNLASYLENKLSYIENNLPMKFNKLENLNGTADLNYTLNDISNTPQQFSSRRQLKFAESFCFSAQKPLAPQPAPVPLPYLTQTEFQSIPAYMRGRVTYDVLNSFIDKINSCLDDKYSLLRLPKDAVKKRYDLDRFILYKRQECPETKGKRFITQDDLKTVTGGKVDKVTLNFLTMLRHTKRIREMREKNFVRYIITSE